MEEDLRDDVIIKKIKKVVIGARKKPYGGRHFMKNYKFTATELKLLDNYYRDHSNDFQSYLVLCKMFASLFRIYFRFMKRAYPNLSRDCYITYKDVESYMYSAVHHPDDYMKVHLRDSMYKYLLRKWRSEPIPTSAREFRDMYGVNKDISLNMYNSSCKLTRKRVIFKPKPWFRLQNGEFLSVYGKSKVPNSRDRRRQRRRDNRRNSICVIELSVGKFALELKPQNEFNDYQSLGGKEWIEYGQLVDDKDISLERLVRIGLRCLRCKSTRFDAVLDDYNFRSHKAQIDIPFWRMICKTCTYRHFVVRKALNGYNGEATNSDDVIYHYKVCHRVGCNHPNHYHLSDY